MPTYITPDGSDAILSWALNSSGVWLALGSGYTSGVFNEISSGLGYSRQYVSGWVVASGVANLPNSVTFGPAATSGWTASYGAVFTTSSMTSGNPWWVGALNPSGEVAIGNVATFPVSGFSIGFQASGA